SLYDGAEAEAGDRETADEDGGEPVGHEEAAQFFHGAANSRLYRAEGKLEGARDLVVGQVLEEGQAQGLALSRGQPVHGGAHGFGAIGEPGLLDGTFVPAGQPVDELPVRVRLGSRAAAPMAELIEHFEMDDLEEPGSEEPLLPLEAGRLGPDREKDFLDEVLGRRGPEALGGDVIHEGGVAAEQR